MVESEMNRSVFIDRRESQRTTLGELIGKYAEQVTVKKRGFRPEQSRIKRLLTHSNSLLRLSQLGSDVFSKYRDERLKEGASDKTVREELLLYSAILNFAKKEWSIPVENFLQQISIPAPSDSRERRLDEDEEIKLLTACQQSPTPSLSVAVTLALETGMRRGEIAGLKWSDVDFNKKIITLRRTKNGDRRSVPMSCAAEAALRKLASESNGKVFSFHDSNGLGAAFMMLPLFCGVLRSQITRPFCAVPRPSVSRIAWG